MPRGRINTGKKPDEWASEMAQQVKALAIKLDNPFDPYHPHGRRRELTPTGGSLTSHRVAFKSGLHCTCTIKKHKM